MRPALRISSLIAGVAVGLMAISIANTAPIPLPIRELPPILDCTKGVDAAAARAAQLAWAKAYKLEPKVTLTIGEKKVPMSFMVIPPSKYLRGGNKAGDDVEPVKAITIDRCFLMAESEVTQAQWKAVMGDDNNPSDFKGDDLPVDSVTWTEANEFSAKLGKIVGKPIRLPTEAEWELAARAGTTTEYSSGTGVEALKQIGWYKGNSESKPHPVKGKVPNAWGLYDMSGNVWEWCEDIYEEDYYGKSSERNPVNRSDDKTTARVLRGGSWANIPASCLSAYRYGNAPGDRYGDLGLRVCFAWPDER